MVRMDTYQVMYALCCCLQLLQHRLADKQKTIVLSKNLSGSVFDWTVDGATVMSENFYKDKGLSQRLILKPSLPSYKFMVQFIYLDIATAKPCQDSLRICELPAGFTSAGFNCVMPMVDKMCGTMSTLFEKNGKRHMTTTEAGRRLLVEWNTGSPSGSHRGFRITVTAISSFDGDCRAGTQWKCSDNTCISRDLHCDKVAHCLDVSDEVVNCSNSDLLPSIYRCDSGGGTFPCVSSKWNERWFGVAIPMLIVLVLFLVAFVVKVRNMICRPPEQPGGVVGSHIGIWQIRAPRRRRRRSSRNRNHSNDTTDQLSGQPSDPQLYSSLYGELLCGDPQQGIHTGGRPVAYDPVNMMLLPPPYSPPTYSSEPQYHPPTEGEPPPTYEEFDTAHSQCRQHIHNQSVNEDDKDIPSQTINQNY